MANKSNNNLICLNWNSNGINNKKEELINFLHHYNVDIACIVETHLNKNNKLLIPNYTVYRADRSETKGGGVLIAVKSCYNHYQTHLPDSPGIEAIAININLNNQSWKIIAAYKPPSVKIQNANIQNYFQPSENTLLLGDLNAKHTSWGCKINNQDGKILANLINQSNLRIISPSEPTYYPYDRLRQPDILDIAITNANINFHLSTIFELDSDHIPVLLSTQQLIPQHAPSPKINTLKINWKKYQTLLRNEIPVIKILKTPLEIDKSISYFNELIISTIQRSQPTTLIDAKINSYCKLPRSILNAIAIKNKTRRLWFQLRTRELKRELNLISNIVKKLIKNYKNQQFHNQLNSLNSSSNSLWQFTRKILKKKNTIPPLKTTTGKAYSSFHKAEELANYFATTFELNNSIFHPDHNTINNKVKEPIYGPHHNIQFTSPNEITKIIKNLPNKKSPGHDFINTMAVKYLPPPAIAFLTNIYNSCFRTGYFPLTWKHAIIVPISKPGKNAAFTDSYRPISLLPTLSKIFEKIILRRLNKHLNLTKSIPIEQFGFTEKISTQHQLLRITEYIYTAFQKKQHTIAIFIDITKAFDRVWHQALRYKLIKIGTPHYIISIINSFLTNRTFSVNVNNHISNPRTINAGLPQGSPLSPTLFNLYVADLPKVNNIQIAQFADDTAIFSSDASLNVIRNKIQLYLHMLDSWACRLKIQLNPSKTSAKIFTLRPYTPPTPMTLNNNTIEWLPPNKPVKYLGLQLDTKLNWKHHIDSKLTQAKIKLMQLKPLIHRGSSIPLNSAILIYKTVLRPLLLYACPIWINASKTNTQKIQVIQNQFLRTIVNAPWFVSNHQLHKELNLEPIAQHITYLSTTFYSTLNQIPSLAPFRLGKYPNRTRIKNKFPYYTFLTKFAEIEPD